MIQVTRSIAIHESEIQLEFVRASGPGGQNVNKVATCVILRHRQTGLMVRCQHERSQALNRFLARRLLLDKIEKKKLGALSAEKKRIYKIRRQKKRRSRRVKEKMLREKHLQAEKKALRAPIRELGE